VLHVITRMILGGAQENTLLTVEGLDRMDRFEVTLASGDERGREGTLLTRARASTRLVVIPQLRRSVSPVHDVAALWKLYRLMRRERYDVVHTHSSKAGVLGRVAARLAGTPVVVHTLHGLVFHERQPWVVNRLWRAVKRLMAPLTDHFVSVADAVTDGAVAARIAPADRFTTIRSGMELDWFLDARVDVAATRRELGLPPDAPVVGKVARLFPLKGHDQLLEAWPAVVARHPAARLLLVGDGVLQERLEVRARELGVRDSVVFAGLVARERIPATIAAMDVLVHTSLLEGLARVLPQALALGRPCVSVALDGAPEVVIDGETGFLVEPGDPAALAEAISRLVADPDLRARMGVAGRRLVDPAFRAETMVQEIAALYDELLSTR
jgi:glycosyltransferase involved in cell wall biosynthesis